MSNETFNGNGQYGSIKDFRQLKRGQKVFTGDKPDARDCDSLRPAKVEKNWPSQWHARYTKGNILLFIIEEEKYLDIAEETIDGKPAYIFPATDEVEAIYSKTVRKT